MKMKKLILLTLFIVTVSSTVAASYSLTITAENSESELVTADEICVNSNCVEREFSHTFSVPENQDATITIQDSEYENIQTSEYVFADMKKTYTLQQTDQNVELKIEAVNKEGEYVTADEICVDGSCVEREFSHTFKVKKDQDVSVSIEDSDYDNIQNSVYVSGDITKTYELTRTDTRGSLEVHVEDNDGMNGKAMEDAKVTLSDGVNKGPKYTDSTGDVDFGNLPSNTDIDVQVECYGETENKYNVEIDEGEQKDVDVNFEKSFDSSVCGEDTDEDPVARFDIDDENPDVEQWVDFDASDSEGNIEKYHWKFGDSDTYTDDDPRISHRYNTEGTYTVELTVEEHDGDKDTKTREVSVSKEKEKNSDPEVDLRRPDDNQKIHLPYSLRWDASDPDSDDVESTIYIGESREGESTLGENNLIQENVGEDESFELTSSDLSDGEYIWKVKVTDENDATTWSNIRTFTVETEDDEDPVARFNIDNNNPKVNEWVEFDASNSEGNIEKYHWKFGDSDTYTDDDPKISHRYNKQGEITVELTVEEQDGDKDTKTKTLNVQETEDEEDLKADFAASDYNPEVDQTITFNAENSEGNIESFEWSFDDGEANTGEVVEHSFDEEGEYNVELTVIDSDGNRDTRTRTINVGERDVTGPANLKVIVEDSEGDLLENARVVVDNSNWFSSRTDSDGEVGFEVESGSIDVTVSKEDYETETQRISLESGENRDLTVTLSERDTDPEQARLDVHVEDDDYNDLEDAKVTVENSDYEIRYTDSDGDTRFYLDSDDYDIEVECNGEKEYRDVYLSEGEREDIDIRFDKEFSSDICGEGDDRNEDTYDDRDEDDDTNDDAGGLAITDVSYPDSVCRGGSFSTEMRIENLGGFHEIVTITGSGLGSISTGQSFSLDVAETKSASIRFTNVEGSNTEEFDIRATNHVSDQTTRTIDVRDCGAQTQDTDGRDYFDNGAVTGVTAEVTPKKTAVGNTVKVKGYVDGVRGRSQVNIQANDERKATVSTQPDGYYVAYIRLNQIGENIIKVSSGQAETQSVVKAIPTSTLTGVSAPEKVFEGESYEICTNVNSEIEPKVYLLRDGKIVDSTLANGEVCFERTASKIGENEFRIKALTYGKESSSPTATTEVLEVDSEVTNFPDKVATTESEEGMVKVELYNTHNDLKRYNVKLNGIKPTWLSQSEEEVILNKGEKETVYFYLTPEEEGNFEPIVEVVSRDTKIYSEKINVYAGGTKNLRKPSFFGRLGQIFGL